MVYKSFRINCIVRILSLIALILLFIYLIFKTELYVSAVITGVIIIIQIFELIHFVEKTNRHLTRFLDSIKYSDFTQTFARHAGGKSFEGLNMAFNEVIAKFQETRTEKEEQYRYLNTVIQHIGIGLISFQTDGSIELINTAFRKILQISNINNINDLNSISPTMVETMIKLKGGENGLVKINLNNELIQLAIYSTEFRQRQKNYRLVSIQNITGELAEKEMEAWQSLVRVLTHEIMNSVTPISSLASTVNDLLLDETSKTKTKLKAELNSESISDIGSALETIQKRSVSLLNFMENYRNLTRIPKPDFQQVPISELFNSVLQLMKTQLENQNINFKTNVDPSSLELTADSGMLEQVLINLLLNAIHAVEQTDSPIIKLTAEMGGRGNILIKVSDNGSGIPDESQDKIFIPFYTTKKEGSGIGLSLSRQILRKHHASLTVTSVPNQETLFILKF
ncbi:MAG: GHKL domain-containing protein [candidate division Zixibacteria bacterium]|nr:GHKL domain-containing protein [candidate division Zixibacteria bacterium]